MKRVIYTFLVLIAGIGIGGGGLFVAMNWDKLNPLKKDEDKAKQTLQTFLAGLRKECAADPALKGVLIKSVDVSNGKLNIKGLVASKDQSAILESKGKTLLEETEELRNQCGSGVSTEGLKVLAIHDQLANLQRDFDEGRGAEKDEDAVKRQIMRATRLDGVKVAEDGKLVFTGVCIHGNTKTDVSKTILLDAVSGRLEALGVLSHMPDIALDVRFFPPPAVTLQNQLSKNFQAKDVHVISAWYDAKGKLHVAGLVGQDSDRKLIENALSAFDKDPQTTPVVKGPDAAASYTLQLSTFAGDKRVLELQRKLVEYARKENKPHLRRVRLEQILATALEDDRKKIRTDDEGNILYYFRVTGRLWQVAGDQTTTEKDLQAWLVKELPKVPNPDRKPIAPKFAFDVQPSPIFALQDRVVQRGLDGTVFTDALFDEKGELELLGRLHQADEKSKQALATAVKDLLAKEPAWSLASLKAHETTQAGQTIAWPDAVRACQAKLAQGSSVSERVRVDRLYFNYDKEQLGLYASGVFLADSAKENPDGALRKAIDDAIATRGPAYVKTAGLKHVSNPLVELQNQTTERADLDGVLVTRVRYSPDGLLQVAGYLGDAGHKAALTPIVALRVQQSAHLLKKGSDPKTSPGWSIEMKPYAAAKGDMKWSEFLRACQSDLAAAPDSLFRRTGLGRAYFQYAEAKDAKPRRLLLQCKAIFLTGPQDDGKDGALKQKIEQKLDAVSKRILADITIDQTSADLTQRETPIFELQKQAFAKSYDGMLFQDAFYDRDGKLAFDGIRGSAEQLKQAKELIDQLLADKEKKELAPTGVAPLDGLRLIAWQPMLDNLRGQFALDKSSLYKQTRLDRAYFQYDKTHTKALLHFKGICIYAGEKLKQDEQISLITDNLQKHLKGKGIDDFPLDLGAITRAANPAKEMQSKATAQGYDGVVFHQIGFDAKGNCYVKLPFYPVGQKENVRKLIEEYSKSHPHLGPIREEAYDVVSKAGTGGTK